jgi:putative acetyltransferase
MKFVVVATDRQIQEARLLFKEYAASLPFDLCFQNFDKELADLPGEYGSPRGRLFLAVSDNDAVAGCVALRLWRAGIGEMKRLFVRPAFRGKGVGKKLALAMLEAARHLGYARVRLDTTPTMTEAMRLYESLGFRRVEPYRDNPIAGAVFLEIDL